MNLYKRFSFWMVTTSPGSWLSQRFYATVGPTIDRGFYRLSGGRFLTGAGVVPMLLLTTIGRRTGRPRTTPVVYLRAGQDVVLVASNVGNPGHPQWFRNLKVHPMAQLSIRGRTRPYLARVTADEERAQLWSRLTRHAPTYALYQTRAGRELPVLVLTPAASH